ncbi:MAG: type II toxin-antitoxin system Phd/YefM family antitoxin [Chloroflexota bacterium]|nr:type II toxin-antitoxin system Phd/YefM family antitoxin [Chloroflexota bacterium]
MSTKRLNMHEAKTHLSEHVARLKEGDRIILCRRNQPVAEIRPLMEPTDEPRPAGLGKGLVEVPDSFFDPLPDDILDLFEGKAD